MTFVSRQGGGEGGSGRSKRLWVGSICALVLVGGLLVIGASLCESGGEEDAAMAGGLMGAPKDVKNVENSIEIDEIGRFAVQEHNTKEGKNLTFKKVVTAKQQVVSGTLYHLTLEATQDSSSQPKLFDAKVWHKPWESHKSLEEFKEAGSSVSVSSDTQETSGLRTISVEDPVIKEAAERAVKGLNSKSNSLVPYELKDIISAQAKVDDVQTEFELHLKVSKGGKVDDVKTGIHRTAEGKWTVKQSDLV